MRTVTSRKELLDGIKAGERHFKVKGKSLLLQCSLAEKFNGSDNVTNTAVANAIPTVGARLAISGPILLAMTAMVIVGTISIIAVLKGRRLKIKVKDKNGNECEIEIF